jgi:hypothetical protein
MFELALAGALSAIPTTIITTPMERVKVVLQTQDQTPNGTKYKGLVDAGAGMWREGGVRSLYRGTIATLARDIPGSAAYFVGFEFFHRLLKPKDASGISIGATLFSGGRWGRGASRRAGLPAMLHPPHHITHRITSRTLPTPRYGRGVHVVHRHPPRRHQVPHPGGAGRDVPWLPARRHQHRPGGRTWRPVQGPRTRPPPCLPRQLGGFCVSWVCH